MHEKTSEAIKGVLFLAGFVLLAVGVSICVAMDLEGRGEARIVAILIGAACGVIVAWMLACIVQRIRCAVWRLSRGYPFARGDVVEITSGRHRGQHGEVVSVGQAPWIVEIAFHDQPGTDRFWAGHLRRVS